jgi:hypothetical protein
MGGDGGGLIAMTKVKRSNSYTRYFLTRFLGTIGFIVCGLLSTCSVYMSVGIVQPSLDAELFPTAEYLYEHPQATPTNMTISLHYEQHEQDYFVCYRYTDTPYSYRDTIIVLNGAAVSRFDSLPRWHDRVGDRPGLNENCIHAAKLDKGLHLVELNLRRWPWDEPYIYQGAVMVEK